MVTHKEAVEAYRTLAEYMQNCYSRAEKCPRCLFHMHYKVCLIQRLGLYPNLAFDTEDVRELDDNLKRLEEEEK